jgi:hypothetical protein
MALIAKLKRFRRRLIAARIPNDAARSFIPSICGFDVSAAAGGYRQPAGQRRAAALPILSPGAPLILTCAVLRPPGTMSPTGAVNFRVDGVKEKRRALEQCRSVLRRL